MVVEKVLENKYEQHMFLSQVAEEIGRFNKTDKTCLVCGGEFLLQCIGSSYVLQCETDNCLKLTSRGI